MHRRLLAAVTAGLAAWGVATAQSPGPVSYVESAPQTETATALGDGSQGRSVWATGEYLLWFTRNQTSPLVALSVPAGSTALGTLPAGTPVTALFPGDGRKIDFDAQSGVRGRVGTSFGTAFGADIGGFVLDRKSTGFSGSSSGTPSLARAYTRASDGTQQYLYSALPGAYGGQLTATADTRLWGIDGNVRTEWYRLFVDRSELLTGFRYVNLKESLQISDRSDLAGGVTSAVRDSFQTENEFYGPQAGFHVRLFGYRGMSLEIIDTFGLGAVRQKVTIDGSNSLTGFPDEATGLYAQKGNIGSHSRTQFAATNEGTVNLGYEFTPHIRGHVGYSIFWLSSAVRPGTAVDQTINDSNIRYIANPPPDATSTRPNLDFGRAASDFWAQGLTLGLTIEY